MKVSHFLYSAICILLMVISCQKEPEVVKVESVSLNSTSMTLVEGETQSLTATVSPSTATNKKVIWSSSNSSVASVDDRGTVTAIAPGTATITAKSDDGGKTATCTVTVNSKVISVESVSLDKTTAEITEGETITLTATVKPDNATNKKVIWSSSNEEVAIVKDGVVTAIKDGDAIITAKTEDGGKTATCSVVVKEKVYPVESIELDKTTTEITEGETLTLTATVKPENASNKNVIWSSSNEEIATVKDGVVTAIKAGEVTITAKTEDGGKTATCAVKVNAKVYPVESISLDKTSVELTEMETATLTATVKPDNASNKKVIWSSSNEEIATVKDGVVTAIKAGEATITAKTEDGGKTATCSVKVIAKVYPVESISLDKTSASLKVGETTTLTATIKPDNASNKKVIWSSSNGEIATVTDGVVTAIKAGEATITAKTEDGEKTATCAVKVNAKIYPVESISLDKTSVELTESETATLTATVKPDNASNKKVIWSSSNEEVATIKDGVVTAIKAGEATITAKTEDGGKTATCSVKVIAKVYPVESISLDKTSASLKVGETTTLTATVKPDNASNKKVIWSSSNVEIANVKDGVVTAIKEGEATITAKTEDGGKTATCAVTVTSKVYPVESITLDKSSVELTEGETTTLTATIKPDNATNKKVIWSSSNSSVATVDEGGTITAIASGSASITAKTEDGGKTATCSVKVNAQAHPVESVELNRTSASLKVGETTTLTATVKPDNASDKTVTWSSSDASVASVEKGVVTAKKIGTATITAKAGGKTATCSITVEATPVTSIELDKTSASLKVGETLTLTATVKPSNATNKKVIWSSSNEEVATVEDGVVTALKEGEAIITAKTEDGGKTATCTISSTNQSQTEETTEEELF